jgi:predicted Rossmann fold nucleotide-binding protein DprA/Smf involved in DNA uptake
LAIVGSRDVDEEALRFTHEVALRCAEQHLQVVSGGARGVDREALSTALETGGTILAIPVDRLLKVVTERAARSALHDQQLTVVTPYDPELGFTVGRAMGRNKYIYALADFALVVRFKTEEGGTWAGAVEQLRSNTTAPFRVSVFVRIKNNSETGWRKLQSLGALPFPEERLHDGAIPVLLSDVASSARDQVYAPAARSSHAPSSPADGAVASPPSIVTALPQQVVPPALTSAPPPDAPVVADPDSCYCRCLGLLLQELRQEPSKKQLTQIARRLELVPQQFNKWLQRALGEGKVLKKRKGGAIVYTDASIAEDSMLFGRTGDVAVPCESPAQSSDSRPPEPGE